MKSASAADPSVDRLPSQAVRTVVSLLLFAHLFALTAAVLSNPQDDMASRLLLKLGNVPFLSRYTELLWMESAYDFFYTYGNNEFVLPLSTDHQMEAELTLAGGGTQTVSIPDVGGFPRVRYQHYKNLCNNAARTVGQQGAESFVPAAVLESLMRSADAVNGTIRTKRRLMQRMEMATSSDSQTRDPNAARYWRVIYTGYGQLRSGRSGPFTYQKLEDAGTSAPVGGASSAAPATSSLPPSTAAPAPSTAAPPPSTAAPPPGRPAPRNSLPQRPN